MIILSGKSYFILNNSASLPTVSPLLIFPSYYLLNEQKLLQLDEEHEDHNASSDTGGPSPTIFLKTPLP
jgi:hypothetical protein